MQFLRTEVNLLDIWLQDPASRQYANHVTEFLNQFSLGGGLVGEDQKSGPQDFQI